MHVSARHLVAMLALRAEQAVELLIPLASLAVLAALLNPRLRSQLGCAGTVTCLTAVLLVGPTAVYAAGRM